MPIVVFWFVMSCGLVGEVNFTLNMEAVCSSDILVTIYKTVWTQNPEDRRRENSLSHK
jgi:hypothetical protein